MTIKAARFRFNCLWLAPLLGLLMGFSFFGFSGPQESLFGEVYEEILSVKCANALCHGRAFEPYMDTPLSAFNSLVYHPVTKNNRAGTFSFRVVPYDTTGSVLHERITNCCFVNANDRMPQSKIGGSLSDPEIRLIEKWIMMGAPDLFGKILKQPQLPLLIENSIWLSDKSGIRAVDSSRREANLPYGSIEFRSGEKIGMQFFTGKSPFSSDSIRQAFLQVSTSSGEFSMAKKYPAFKNGNAWQVLLDSQEFQPATRQYFRFCIDNGLESSFPGESSPAFIRQSWSFKILSGGAK